MSEEEIYFWLKVFCDKNQFFVYEERKISLFTVFNYILDLKKENKQLKDNWNKLKEELKEKFEEFRYVEDECLRIMAQEDDSILFSMSCIEKGDSNE